MKTFFILCAGCIFSYNAVIAQAVGIGTASPHASAQLDVASTTKGLLLPRMTSTQRNAIVSPAAGLTVYETTTGTLWVYNGSTWNQLTSGVPPSSLWQTSATRNFVYNTTDSIGIGTSLPSEKLQISNGQLRMNRTLTSAENSILFNMPNPTAAGEFEGLKFQVAGVDRSAIGFLNVPPNFGPAILGLRFSGKGLSSNDLFIDTSGNVGVGTNAPTAKLYVAGNIRADESIFSSGTVQGAALVSSGQLVTLGNGTITGNLQTNSQLIINDNAAELKLKSLSDDKGFVQLSGDNIRVGTYSTNTLGKFIVRTGGGDRMIVDGSGVAIGTTTAAPGYLLRVGGKMICEELKVKLRGTWPDYVFKTNYKLRNLNELENYINVNNHLPNIPPAAEIEKNGLAVGDMQKRMMEKIEELTLYVIDLQKQIEVLKNGKN